MGNLWPHCLLLHFKETFIIIVCSVFLPVFSEGGDGPTPLRGDQREGSYHNWGGGGRDKNLIKVFCRCFVLLISTLWVPKIWVKKFTGHQIVTKKLQKYFFDRLPPPNFLGQKNFWVPKNFGPKKLCKKKF